VRGCLQCTDDGNVCTNDRCDGAGACTHPPNSYPCDDGAFCNGADTCSGGSCSLHAGDPCAGGSECADSCNEAADDCYDLNGTLCADDANVCTDDVCDGAGACTHPANSASCDDGLFCTGTDTCSGGSCSHAGDPCPGPDGDADCVESCDEGADSCTAADPNGSACDDGLFCTGVDTCSGGSCSHAGDPCPGPDGDAHCVESCDEGADDCTAADPNGSSCDDGLFCTGTDTCSGGSCSLHTGDPCVGGSECADSCNETADDCYEPLDTLCTNDANVCTDDVCDGTGACTHPANSDPCDDGVFCNGVDTCSGGSCIHPGDPCLGPDGDADCVESCDEGADSCTAADPNGSACDDGLFCNAEDLCFNGSCSFHAGDPCPGPDGDADCAESCDEGGDACTAADPNGSACDDGLFCSGPDTCSGGSCSLHAGDPCPGPDADADCVESCDEGADGCTAADPDGSACDDGLFCNAEDICFAGSCTFHAGDPCPGPDGDADCAESCDEGADDCTAPDLNGSSCNDGDVCSTADTCSAGSCSAGPPLDCDDSDECTADSCDAFSGCEHEWICAAGVLFLAQRRPSAGA